MNFIFLLSLFIGLLVSHHIKSFRTIGFHSSIQSNGYIISNFNLRNDLRGRVRYLYAKKKKSNSNSRNDDTTDEIQGIDTNVDDVFKLISDIEEKKKISKSIVTSSKLSSLSTNHEETNITELPITVKVEAECIIQSIITSKGLFIRSIIWNRDRIEITVSMDLIENISPSSDLILQVHQLVFNELDVKLKDYQIVEKFEIMVASPGIGEVLVTDRDFTSFKGFDVTVATKEEYKNTTVFKGGLIGRMDGNVVLSIKGKLLKIPVEIIDEVRLPKPKFEPQDMEIKKLR